MNGIVNFYKEPGMSSFQAVKKLRWIFGIKKAGHLGTLDPLAEGVLPICLGYATRFADYVGAVDKRYLAEYEFGYRTDSFDNTGNVLEENREIKPEKTAVDDVIQGIVGDTELTIPSFSAVKIDGKRAYKLAREGKIQDAGKRIMKIYSIDSISYEYPKGIMDVKCGKGTYIRSIIDEMGARLGCFAVMTGLVRTENGTFTRDKSYSVDELMKLKEEGRLVEAVTPVWEVLDWPVAVVNEFAEKLIRNGAQLEARNYISIPEGDYKYYFLATQNGEYLAAAEPSGDFYKPLKPFIVFGK